MMHDVIIPARHESEETLIPTIQAFRVCSFVARIILVNDGLYPDTLKAVARYADLTAWGPRNGKGAAVMEGLEYVTAGRVVLCDGDLTGFRPHHAQTLTGAFSWPSVGRSMIRGLTEALDGHPPWPISQQVRQAVTGERSIPTELIQGVELHGYAMEVQINDLARRAGLRVRDVRLRGVRGKARWDVKRAQAVQETLTWIDENWKGK